MFDRYDVGLVSPALMFWAPVRTDTASALWKLGTLLGIGLVGVVLTLLVRGLPGRAAAISQWAVLPYVLSYGAAEAIQGPATAVLVRYANGVPDAERATAAGAVQALWDDVVVDDVIGAPGAVAWLVAVIAAAVAHRQAGAPWGLTALLGAAAVTVIHTPLQGRSASAVWR